MKFVRGISVAILVVTMVGAALVTAQQIKAGDAIDPAAPDYSLTKELERCNGLGDQALYDARCQAASREAARRFFQPPPEYHPAPVEMFPKTKDQPLTTGTKPSPPSSNANSSSSDK